MRFRFFILTAIFISFIFAFYPFLIYAALALSKVVVTFGGLNERIVRKLEKEGLF